MQISPAWLLTVGLLGSASPADLDAPTRARVNQAVDKGIRYLRLHEDEVGDDPELTAYPSGAHCLLFYTLQMAGVPADDPLLARLDPLVVAASRDVDHTYTLSLALLGLLVRDREQHKDTIRVVIGRLVDGQFATDPGSGAWGYVLPGGRKGLAPDRSKPSHPTAHWEPPDGWWDHSNTQYAILALRAAVDYGFEVSPAVFERTLGHLLAAQNGDGGFGYSASSRPSSYIAMTAGAMGSAILCADVLDEGEDARKLRGRLDRASAKTASWLRARLSYPPSDGPWPYYAAYAIERLGHFANLEQFGDHDWYAEGVAWLLPAQGADGSWNAVSLAHNGRAAARSGPLAKKNRLQRTGNSSSVVDTCFALLFLKRSSFVHTQLSDEVLALLRGIDPQIQEAQLEQIRARILKVGEPALPQLVKGLFLPAQVTRRLSAACLRELTGESMGYDAATTPDEERAARQRWVEYLMQRRQPDPAGG